MYATSRQIVYSAYHQVDGAFQATDVHVLGGWCVLGEDALVDVVDASDMNSIAGVLKLYFRELREPLFPLHLFDALVECTRKWWPFVGEW